MRKYAFLLAIILLLAVATACAANTTAPTNSDTLTVTEETTSTVVSESPISTAESEPTAAASEPTETTSQAATSAASTPTPTPSSTSKPTDPPKTSTPVELSKPAASTAPVAIPSQPPTSAPTTTEPPVTSTAPVQPAFDINEWIAFAKSYGQQIGLIYDAGTTGSWDNPIAAGATLKYTERDIKGYLDGYVRDGVKYFSVWAEKRTDGSGKYDIFIGYA